mmetsp:Transcript_8534/g.12588  ORF Transcript_8534/g.12588 Transcript_8534/m.12588 type:complete len:126 (-) Transcript_8534:29-406(-)
MAGEKHTFDPKGNMFSGDKFGTQEVKAIYIRIFRNGDKHHAGEKFKVHPKIFKTWDQVLVKMSQTVNLPTGACRKVYTVKGKVVKKMESLKDGHYYICCAGEPLHKETLKLNKHFENAPVNKKKE